MRANICECEWRETGTVWYQTCQGDTYAEKLEVYACECHFFDAYNQQFGDVLTKLERGGNRLVRYVESLPAL